MAGATGLPNKPSKAKWYALRMANRIPLVRLERELLIIGRTYAESKQERIIEEGKLWQFLFDNRNALKDSLTKHTLDDILSGAVPLKVKRRTTKEIPPPYSEVYREFIIFKAHTMARLFGEKAKRRPRYADLYAREKAPAENNARNIRELFELYSRELSDRGQSIFSALTPDTFIELPLVSPNYNKKPSKPLPKEPKEERPRTGFTPQPIQAKPFHKKKKKKVSKKGAVEGKEAADRCSTEQVKTVDGAQRETNNAIGNSPKEKIILPQIITA